MSYIPPHKRHLKDPVRPSPVPVSLVTTFKSKLNLKKTQEIVYSKGSTSKWFLIGSNEAEDELKLVPFSSDFPESKNGEKPFVLLKNNLQKDVEEIKKSEWKLVAEKVEDDLVLAIEKSKKEMKDHDHNVHSAKLRLVARFGNILFYRHEAGFVSQSTLKLSRKVLNTNVSTSLLQNIKSKLIPNYKFCFDEEKDAYIVKISHNTCPNAIMSCKCILKGGQLSMNKVELNHVRHLVVDVSCLDRDLDMRLMLSTKRKLMALTEKEISNIKELLDSATVDPSVKGGLRWSLGKASSSDGYSIIGIVHIKATTYVNQTLRLKVQEADRFEMRSGTGEVKREVDLILKSINIQLQEENTERGCVLKMFRDAIPTIWDFLPCDDA